jgi:hypothetical protein
MFSAWEEFASIHTALDCGKSNDKRVIVAELKQVNSKAHL